MPNVSSLHSKTRPDDAEAVDREASLIERLQRQDPSAIQDLIDLHGDAIRKLVGRLMAFDPEMEDVIQNTIVQVWRNIGSFRNQSSLKTWITRIAMMQCRNQQRSVRRWMRRLHDRWKLASTQSVDSHASKTRDDPRWELIQAAMKQLPYRDREILVLVYIEGNSVQELAGTMNEKRTHSKCDCTVPRSSSNKRLKEGSRRHETAHFRR